MPPRPATKRKLNVQSLKSCIASNRTGMIVPTSNWGEGHLTAFGVKLHRDSSPFSLPPGVKNKVKSVYENIRAEISDLEQALPNLASQSDSAIRVACLEGTRGQYMSFTLCLAEILCTNSTSDQTDGSPDGSSQQQAYGRGCRRSTRRVMTYERPQDSDSSEESASQSSSHSLTDVATLKGRAHAEVLNVRLAVEFLGLVCFRWREGCDGVIEGSEAQFLFSYVPYVTLTGQC